VVFDTEMAGSVASSRFSLRLFVLQVFSTAANPFLRIDGLFVEALGLVMSHTLPSNKSGGKKPFFCS
jgi:hypothetical protein